MNFPGFFTTIATCLRYSGCASAISCGLRNNLSDDPTNLHFHGMNVSPRGRSDNVFINVRPGREFEYEVIVPRSGRQEPGLFWYHPHDHGFVNKQMLGGLSGGLVVDGSETLFPMLKDLPERFFLIKHAEPGGGREVISINGQMNPVVEIRPGEIQFWRIAHIGASLFFPFQIEGMPLYVVATDRHPLSRPRKSSEVLIGPGQRIDQSRSGRRPASTPWQRSYSRTWLGGSRFRRSKSRPSCPPDRRGHRTPKPRFCV